MDAGVVASIRVVAVAVVAKEEEDVAVVGAVVVVAAEVVGKRVAVAVAHAA